MAFQLFKNWALDRLSERSTWVSFTGFASMIGFGVNPEIINATTENAPLIVGGVWAIVQSVLSDKK